MAFPMAGSLMLPSTAPGTRAAPACRPAAPALRSAFLGERRGSGSAHAFCGCQLRSAALLRPGRGSRTAVTMAAKGAAGRYRQAPQSALAHALWLRQQLVQLQRTGGPRLLCFRRRAAVRSN